MRWTILLAVMVLGCSAQQHQPSLELAFPAVTLNERALFGATGFLVGVDPTFFEEVSAQELIEEIWGITAVAPRTGDTFGGARMEPLHFSSKLFEYSNGGYVKRTMQPIERMSTEGRERVEEILLELRLVLIDAIDSGGWNKSVRERMRYTDTRALAVLRVGLRDPTSSKFEAGGAPGTIHLCISYLWDLETEPELPPPRVFIPSSRNTTTVFELSPEHVPKLLDCYRRILEAVDGPYKSPHPEFEEDKNSKDD